MRMRAGMFAAAALVIVAGGYLLLARREPPPPTAAPQPRPIPQATAPAPSGPPGSIEGEVDFTGPTPAPGKLHREADPYCARTEMTDPTVLAAGGKLANVWVHVTSQAPDAPLPQAAVEMD